MPKKLAIIDGAAEGPEVPPEPKPVDRRIAVLLAVAALTAAQGGKDGELAALKDKLRAFATEDPLDALLATVLGGGLLFHHLEKGKNPRCNTYWDAVLYVATSLSVGFDDVIPKTEGGHALAALIQTLGPSLAAQALAPPASRVAAAERAAAAKSEELLEVNRRILEQLAAIAGELKARPPA